MMLGISDEQDICGRQQDFAHHMRIFCGWGLGTLVQSGTSRRPSCPDLKAPFCLSLLSCHLTTRNPSNPQIPTTRPERNYWQPTSSHDIVRHKYFRSPRRCRLRSQIRRILVRSSRPPPFSSLSPKKITAVRADLQPPVWLDLNIIR